MAAQRANLKTFHNLGHCPLKLAAVIEALSFLQDTFLVNLRISILQVGTMLFLEILFSIRGRHEVHRTGELTLGQTPEMWIQTASFGLKTTVLLIIVRHEDGRHLLLLIVAIENALPCRRQLSRL